MARTLTSTLEAAQQSTGLKALVRIVLTYGANSYTYTRVSANPILTIDHREEPFSQKATVVIQDYDATLLGLDLRGYKGVISYGATTSAGDEYSACAPLYVMAQEAAASSGRLISILTLKGIMDMLDDDKATGIYIPTLTETPKDIIAGALGASTGAGTVFSNATAWTATWDSEDSLVDSFVPKQNFIIPEGMSRLAVLRRGLSFTKVVCRIQADGEFHFSVPKISGQTWVANTAYEVHDYVQPSTVNNNFTYECTTAGTSHASTEPTWPTTAGNTVTDGTVVWTARAFDYEYSLASGDHPFFAKTYRNRVVRPNFVTVASMVGDVPAYSGTATDPSYTLTNMRVDTSERLRLASNAQATAIAKALINKYQVSQEGGTASVPNNVGAEVFDYVKVTAPSGWGADVRLGNQGFVHRKIDLSKNKWEMNFGFGGWLAAETRAREEVNVALGWKRGEGSQTNVALNIITDVGADLLQSNDTQATTTATTYTKVREILCPCYGYLRVKFDLQTVDPGTAYGKLYRNGIAIGTERTDTTASWVTFSEDFSGFKPGDLLQLYCKTSNGVYLCYYRNFRLYWERDDQNNPYTPLFTNIL